MATLTSGIDADATTIAISGDVSAAVTGAYYSLEDEIIQLRAFAPRDEPHYRAPRGPDNRQRWIVTRGTGGSTAASHAGGTAVLGVSDAFVAGAGVPLPDPLTTGGAVEQTVLSRTVTLTDAQIKALPTTPVEVVPAPGADKLLMPIFVLFQMQSASNYTNIDSAARLHVDNEGDISFLTQLKQSVNSQVSELLANSDPNARMAVLSMTQLAPADENPVDLSGTTAWWQNFVAEKRLEVAASNGSAGNFTGGNASNSLSVTVLYFVVDL